MESDSNPVRLYFIRAIRIGSIFFCGCDSDPVPEQGAPQDIDNDGERDGLLPPHYTDALYLNLQNTRGHDIYRASLHGD